MSKLALALRDRFFESDRHPYRIFEQCVRSHLQPHHTLLDAGCGRTAPVLASFRGSASRLIGVDLVEFTADFHDIELHRSDLERLPLPDRCVDVVMARSVMEHVTHPLETYRELGRVLKPGGRLIFLTANLWDYASLGAKLIPNRLHPWLVARMEGRAEEDVFPTAYKTNTRRAVQRWSRQSGFEIESFAYLGQYPAYFLFNAPLFLIATAYEKVISNVALLQALRGWILVVLVKTGEAVARERGSA